MPVSRRRAVKAREEDEDVKPKRRALRSEESEEYEERPKRSSRRADDDDEDEPARKPRRSASRDDSDDGSPKATATSGSGWGKVASKAKQVEDNAKNNVNEFWLADGESAIIQFYEDEPYCTEGHTVQQGKKYTFVPCQLTKQRHCLLCEEAVTHSWKAAFKVFDHRGTWDKDKRRFKHDKLVEKVWLIGPALTEQLKAYVDKKGKTLSKIVLEVSRTGAGKKAAYNIEVAWDEDEDRPMKPKVVKSELDSLDVLYAPPTDEFIADNYI
jgi:hypothetical protein